MRKYWILLFTFSFFLLLSSCDSDQLTAPEFITDVTVSINGLEQDYSVPEGELIVAAFELEILDLDGKPIGGIPAAVNVASGPGSVGTRGQNSTIDGLIPAVFYVSAPLGDTTSVLMAIAGYDTAYISLQIHGEIKPASIHISSDQNPLQVQHFSQPIGTTVYATVLNIDGIPVPDVQVVFTTNASSVFITPTAITDETGMAIAQLDVDGRWFGDVEISASIVGEYNGIVSESGLTKTVISSLIRNTIKNRISQASDASPLIAGMVLNVELIEPVYIEIDVPDTSITFDYSNQDLPISLKLRESGDQYFPNEVIQLNTDSEIGTLPHSVLTNSAGIAETTLSLTGNPGTTEIIASFEPLGLSARMSVDVTVESTLTASMEFTNPGTAVWIDSTYIIQVAVRYLNGGPGVGIPVNPISELGNTTDEIWTTDRNGNVLIPYSPHNGGAEKLTLLIGGLENNDASLEFPVFAGEAHLEGAFEDGEGEERLTSKILRFRIYDDLNQGIPGERITVSTNLGLLDRNHVVTDQNGSGQVIIRRSQISGLGILNVTWGLLSASFSFRFDALPPASLEVELESNQLWVEGYDSSSTHLIASVYDEIGSPVEIPTLVVFEIINGQNPPNGASFANGTAIDSALTSGGVAVARLSAGRQTGGLLLRVKTWRDSARTNVLSLLVSTVAVVAGPPYAADIDFGDPEDAGGGSWSLPVSVRFWDIHRNPIANHFPFFYRNPLTGEVMETNNPNWNITYNSLNTFDPFTIEIWTDEEYGAIHVEREHVFPLVEGVLELHVDPGNFMFRNEDDVLLSRVWAVLTDGHENQINNAPILFTTNRARFWWKDISNDRYIQFFPDVTRKYTGQVDRQNNEDPGVATVYLRATVDELIIDPFSLEVTIQINANVEGNNDVQADPAFIFITRSAG